MLVGEWLGFVINTITMTNHIPERKVAKLKSLLGSAIGDKSFLYRELARIVGSIICSLGGGTYFRPSNQTNVPGN